MIDIFLVLKTILLRANANKQRSVHPAWNSAQPWLTLRVGIVRSFRGMRAGRVLPVGHFFSFVQNRLQLFPTTTCRLVLKKKDRTCVQSQLLYVAIKICSNQIKSNQRSNIKVKVFHISQGQWIKAKLLIFHCFTLKILFSIEEVKNICLYNTACQLFLKYFAKFYYYYIYTCTCTSEKVHATTAA